MEQKQTINFGAGPAKLPQSVSIDPRFARKTLVICAKAAKDELTVVSKLPGRDMTLLFDRLLRMHAAADECGYLTCLIKRSKLRILRIHGESVGTAPSSYNDRRWDAVMWDNDCWFWCCCCCRLAICQQLQQAENSEPSCISLHSFMWKPAPLCSFTGSSTRNL